LWHGHPLAALGAGSARGLCGIGILPMIHGLEAHATSVHRRQAIALPGGRQRLTGD